MGARKKVVVLGGGVAGMSAAHELVERGFEVEVFERKPIAGGKARSIAVPASRPGSSRTRAAAARNGAGAGARRAPPLPGEHGFRFFPGFYKHVVDTMARIPYRRRRRSPTTWSTRPSSSIAPFDRPSYVLPAEFPRTAGRPAASIVFAIVGRALRTGRACRSTTASSSRPRCGNSSRRAKSGGSSSTSGSTGGTSSRPTSRSAAYQKYFGNGITRSLVAAKARRASTKTIGDIFVQIVFEILLPGVAADRVLNGPTNDVWIDPWLDLPAGAAASTTTSNAEVRAIQCERGAGSQRHGRRRRRHARGDRRLFHRGAPGRAHGGARLAGLLGADPSLANLHALSDYVEWMNGIQFYLTEDVPIAHGHAIYVDSPWALTSVSQPQFWTELRPHEVRRRHRRGAFSRSTSPTGTCKGLNGKEARDCAREEIAHETWEQLKRSLNVGGEVLRDEPAALLVPRPRHRRLDADADPSTPRGDTNAEPLLVNYVDTWRLRPEAIDPHPELLPGFGLRAHLHRPGHDGGGQRGRAAGGQRRHPGGPRRRRALRIWNLHEPELFEPLRAYDRSATGGDFRGTARPSRSRDRRAEPIGLRSSPGRRRRGGPAGERNGPARPVGTPEPAALQRPRHRPGGSPSRCAARPPRSDVDDAAAEARASSDDGAPPAADRGAAP